MLIKSMDIESNSTSNFTSKQCFPPLFRPEFKRCDGVVVYVHESNKHEVVCIKAVYVMKSLEQ